MPGGDDAEAGAGVPGAAGGGRGAPAAAAGGQGHPDEGHHQQVRRPVPALGPVLAPLPSRRLRGGADQLQGDEWSVETGSVPGGGDSVAQAWK